MVCITFDDSLTSQYSLGQAKLDQYNIRATFYAIWDLLFDISANATYMTEANLIDLSKKGHDISGHGQGGA
jgi:peptidoglycan/xylan/chitin deacetylase (PgdA/CDA1 family)